MTFLRQPLCQFLTVAAIALLAAGTVTSGKARAECGDYVSLGGKKAAMMPHEKVQPHMPLPCHGPNCSQAPMAPLVPPAPPPTVNYGEWATLLVPLADPLPPSRGLIADNDSAFPTFHADPIFHPPRLSA